MSEDDKIYQQKMQQVACLFNFAVNAIRVRAINEQPGISEAEIKQRIAAWMRKSPEASPRNADGTLVFRERSL